MKLIIIGGGTTGITLAQLLGEEHEITIIENNEERAREIASETHAIVLAGDGSDITVLKEAGIDESDALITTVDDKTNLMVCQIAKSENINKIVSLVHYPKNEELFIKLGINHLVSVVGTVVTNIKRRLAEVGHVRIIAQLGNGEMQIIEMTISEDSSLIGKPAKIKNVTISAIYRSGKLLIPTEKTKLKSGDVLLLVLKTKDLPKVTDLISGK